MKSTTENINSKSILKDLDAAHKINPIIHNITNFVVMQFTANALLAVGASPIMAHAIEEIEEIIKIANALIIKNGMEDLILQDNLCLKIKNGHPMMTKVTGIGCTATAIIGAFCAINTDYFAAAVHGMSVVGIAGEIAFNKSHGPGSLQINFKAFYTQNFTSKNHPAR